MTRGHGGAGLFSDGKFSFFPSASELWSLPRGDDLRSAFDWTCALLADAGLRTPPYPEHPTAYSVGLGEWVLKDYPSDYLPLDTRMQLTAGMVDALDAEIMDESEVVSVRYDEFADGFHLRLLDAKGQESQVFTRRLLVASGRFGPLGSLDLTAHHSFRRLEVGFRIEQPAEHAFFRDMPQLDPKLRFRRADGAVEWRTFCACRQGEAVLTETQGFWTVSGRADCPPTGRSNVGFNTRIVDAQLAALVMEQALAAMSDEEAQFSVSMRALLGGQPEVIATFDAIYGSRLRSLMVEGLEQLLAVFPEVGHPQTMLIGPTLEGVGWYPSTDGDLRLLDSPAWVVGDACGLFRGIVAAMISGHYAASAVLADLASA
jgi:uncharacterized FAD-dependent dehydrogenase